MKLEAIEKIRKRFRREWLLIGIGKDEASSATPRSGRLLAHSARREDIYQEMLRRKGPALITFSDNRLPAGYAAAF